jgi:hypothetical protein
MASLVINQKQDFRLARTRSEPQSNMNAISPCGKASCPSEGERAKLRVAFCVLVFALAIPVPTSCAREVPFKKLYDYYFPKHGEFLNAGYRNYFDRTLFGGELSKEYRLRSRQLYQAFHGNPSAFHAFVTNSDRSAGGEFGGSWVYECLVLLLRQGDERFAELLASEDRETREMVGMAIDPQIDWTKHPFPKTRALYSYRWVPMTQREIRQRQESPMVHALVMLRPDESLRLRVALATDPRFSEVQVHSPGPPGTTPAVISAPKTLTKAEMADLRRFIQQRIHSKAPVIFK